MNPLQKSSAAKRQTKILATLGPASSTKEQITALVEAGANVFRLNFSHGSHENHRASVDMIRAIESETGQPLGIVADMQGPKLRIGEFKDGAVKLEIGQSFRFDLDETPGDETRVSLPHPEILQILDKDRLIFLDDGNVRVRITEKGKGFVQAVIEAGSALSNRKGFNIPDVVIPVPALTTKDKKDLTAALDMGVDWIAQSFVQTPEDVREAKDLIDGRAGLLIKLEKPAALQQFDEILKHADAVMIARGDLGVEIPPEDVPSVQKRIIRQTRAAGKPVIVATQMLESMVKNARPTRAEASDVATAVYDGTDAVMLSAETAVGAYPVKAVEMMDRICRRTESDEAYYQRMEELRPDIVEDPSDAITTAAFYVAQDIEAACIVTYTMSGSTALRMALQRPEVPILCLTPRLEVARRLSLSYGVNAVYDPESNADFTGPARHAAKIVREKGFAQTGQHFVMTAGMPFAVSGSTNILRIAKVEEK
ncbi:MAG: pyruvate kinase [Alphaproteobacteria bacterium]|nr:pyruvate kinase [Alphaproteobacteria bacterium]